MLTEKQIVEIRGHLEAAQNPVFFYDNDADGLCSYVLLRKFIGRGKGVAVRTHPDVDVGYVRKIRELNADYVFVLDRPFLGKKFVDAIKEMQIPIVWIDHHETNFENYGYENLFVYNPMNGKKKSSEPVVYWSYKIANRAEDIWIAIMGCIADHYLPDFVGDFEKKYKGYWGNVKQPFDAYYGTEIGVLARSLSHGLKDSISHVVYLQNFLIKCQGPAEMFLEIDSSSSFGKQHDLIRGKYVKLLERAEKEISAKGPIFFKYGGDLSISSDLSNELSYKYPGRTIMIAFNNGMFYNFSIRGKKVREILEKILPEFDGATGGGHDNAVGARIKTEDLERFKKEFEERI